MKPTRLLLPFVLLATACQRGGEVAKVPGIDGVPAQETATATAPAAYHDISIRGMAERVPVIMYHDVILERGRGAQWFDCSVAEFREQMDLIVSRGLTPISLDQLHRHLTEGAAIPPDSIVLTFDDNYQGFYDHALPILREYGFPAAMFVHSAYVGRKDGAHPKMDWETLRELVKDPLITIGNHTVSHLEELAKEDESVQLREITEAKAKLESELGKTIDYLAYPVGSNSEVTQRIARETGHKMAFTIVNGPAEESPNLFAVNRYVHTRLENALEDRDRALRGGALGIFRGELRDAPVRYEEVDADGVKLRLITGGMPTSVMSETREGVRDFVRRTGAVAGINGGFFAMAAIAGTDNRMVGPCKTADMSYLVPDEEKFRWPKLRNRPLVMWGPKDLAIVPFQPETMRDPSVFEHFMPGMSDVFLAGVWLVRGGVAREREDMNVFGSSDIQDARKRAFLGVMTDGRFVMGASTRSISSSALAKAAAFAGVQEAVLLDSGFSTSLVYGESIKAFGHSSAENPSRPVPHAVVVKGSLDPETLEAAKEEEKPKPEPRRRRRRSR